MANKKEFMINIVDKFLEEYNLKSADRTFLVGFSGGYDSTCLLDILKKLSEKYKFRLVALHLNHNWRGEESLQDELNCKKFCETNSIEFISETLEKPDKKDENSAREARYDFFLKYAQKYQNSVIFTAHTRSDNAETVIYRIVKGTGINGLQGILPERAVGEYKVFRPLLSVSRNEIESYCISKGLVANDDSSNLDIKYKRNFIRHKVMPKLKEINFNAENSIVSLANLAVSHCKIVDEYMDLIKKDLFFEGKILTEKFKDFSNDVMQKLVYDFCIEQKLDYDYKKIVGILDFIKENFDSKSGSRCSLTSDLWLFASSKYIYAIDKTTADKNANIVEVTKEGEYKIPETDYILSVRKFTTEAPVKFPAESSNIAYVDFEEIGLDFVVRTRRDGDFISPFGMPGTMKLKKYLNSKGIFQHDKDELILLAKDSQILWVAGVGLSDKLKVVNKPSHVLELSNTGAIN